LGNNEIDNNAYNYGTNTIGLLHIVKAKTNYPISFEFTKGILGMWQMVSEPQVQTLWPNGPTYTQVSCVLFEILFMKMVGI